MNAYEEQPSNLVYCNSPTFDQQVDAVILYQPDLFIFIVFSSIGCLLNLMIIGLNLKSPEMRKRPGDLFFGLAVAELMLSSHWLISALYQYLRNNKNVESDDAFCQVNAFFSIIAGQFEFFYNMTIYIYVICAVRNMRIIKVVKNWHVHLTIVIMSIMVALFIKLLGLVGKTMFGTCSIISENKFPIKGIGLLVVYIFISLSTLMYLNYKLPRIQKYQKLLKFYQLYMYSCIFTWSSLVICQIMVYLNCRYIHVHLVNMFVTMGNICKLLTTIFLPIIRITDPNIRTILRTIFKISKTPQKKLKAEPVQQTALNTSQIVNNDIINTSMVRNIKSHLINQKNIESDSQDESDSKETGDRNDGIEMIDFNKQQNRGGAILQQLQGQSIGISLLLPDSMIESINLEDYQMDNAVYEQDKSKQLFGNTTTNKVKTPTSPDKNKRQTIDLGNRASSRSRVGSYLDSARQSVDLSNNYYDTLNNSQRESIMYRILSGIILSDRRKNRTFNIDIQSFRGESIYDQKKIYTLDDKLILEELSGIPKKCLELQQFDNIRMVSYCPLLFQSLIERDRVNIEKSLDLIANKNDIIIAARESNNMNNRRTSNLYKQSSMGQPRNDSYQKSRSIENMDPNISSYMTILEKANSKTKKIDDYIFFTNDKQLIMKTISKQQLKYLLDIIKDYYSHIKQNPQSLLMKIYGMYEFKGLDNHELYIILMKNIAPCPSSFIKRKYDLKGCSYNRKVLESYPNNQDNNDLKDKQKTRGIKSALSTDIYGNSNDTQSYPLNVSEEIDHFYSSLLLKDQDFANLEKYIFISQQNKEGLMQILERDVLFLIRNGLINYSLMLTKVDWEKYRQNFLQEDPKSLSHIPQYLRNQMSFKEEQPSYMQMAQQQNSLDTSSMNYLQSFKNDTSMSFSNKHKSMLLSQNPEIKNLSNQNSLNSNITSSQINNNSNISNSSNTPFVASALESEVEQGVFYMIGIIDFLHKYTMTKRITKYSKIIKNMNSKLDQSSSNANVYSQRFIHFCKKIINLPTNGNSQNNNDQQYY